MRGLVRPGACGSILSGMNLNDYLISQPGKDWPRLLHDWIPPLPAACTVWLVNRLGEVIVVADDKTVLMLDVGAGTVAEVARSREHFARLLDTANNADNLLRISLVNACHRAGMNLGPNECYSFKVPPPLGGKYEVTNLTPTELSVHYSFMAYVHKQQDIYWVPEG